MYRIFSTGVKQYFNENQGIESERLKEAEPLMLLADYDMFKNEESKQSKTYINAVLLLQLIESYKDAPGRMGTIAWDLKGMGFSSEGFDDIDNEKIKLVKNNVDLNNQLKLMQMFLKTTVYWKQI